MLDGGNIPVTETGKPMDDKVITVTFDYMADLISDPPMSGSTHPDYARYCQCASLQVDLYSTWINNSS